MCQNPLFNKITLATDICDRGDFHIFGVLTHPLFTVALAATAAADCAGMVNNIGIK